MNSSLKMLLLTVCCLWATLMMASCLNDDDEEQLQNLTAGQMAAERAALRGQYAGMIYIDGMAGRADSVAMHISVSDSMLVSYDFPVSHLIANVSSNADRDILAAALPQQFEATVVPTNINVDGYYGYYVIPTTAACVFDVTTSDDVTHHVTIKYKSYIQDATFNYQPIALYGVGSRDVIANILIYTITIDDNTYHANQVLSFAGSK